MNRSSSLLLGARPRALLIIPTVLALLASLCAPPVPVATAAPPRTVTAIAAGGQHTCALLSDGTVRCWGMNHLAQLGDGTKTASSIPVPVVGVTTATAIAAGQTHTCALLADRTIRCWGSNYYGQLGDGTTTNWLAPRQVVGITTATAITAGRGHTCAVLVDRSLRCWGSNYSGQLGDGTTTTRTTPVTVAGITSATAVAGGMEHTCALLADRGVRCWGHNASGSLGDGTSTQRLAPVAVTGITTATAITTGAMTSCALLADRGLRCWGSNFTGALGDGTTTDRLTPVAVTGITTATAVSAGGAEGGGHTCAVLADGGARCWGGYALGDGTTTRRLTPVQVAGITTATAIATGGGHACARLADRSVWCWGSNYYGQLGDGTTTDRLIPVKVVWAPSVTIAAPASPTNAASLAYTVTFGEPVTGLSASDFLLTGTSSTGCSIGTPAGSGAAYVVTVTGCGEGSVILGLGANTVSDLAGDPGPVAVVSASAVTIDRSSPSAGLPTTKIRGSGAPLAGSGCVCSGVEIPVRVSWSGSDGGGSGIGHYELARSADRGMTWTTVATSLATPSVNLSFPSSGSARFRVRAIDRAGNVGAWATGPVLSPRLVQSSSSAVRYAGRWRTGTGVAYSGGSTRFAKVAGASATYTFTGRSVGLVTTLGPTRGKVRIYVNGSYSTTVDLHAPTTQYRVVAWQRTWSSTATRTVRLVVAGTPGHPRVDLDAFVVLK
jgi:alpha-tubulin suppressor-like RCC1 family protein